MNPAPRNDGNGNMQRDNSRNDNSRPNVVTPRQEQVRPVEPQRQENRTPVFQPRNEPKQFKNETPPSNNNNQRSEPSRAPESKPSGGGRRR